MRESQKTQKSTRKELFDSGATLVAKNSCEMCAQFKYELRRKGHFSSGSWTADLESQATGERQTYNLRPLAQKSQTYNLRPLAQKSRKCCVQ